MLSYKLIFHMVLKHDKTQIVHVSSNGDTYTVCKSVLKIRYIK